MREVGFSANRSLLRLEFISHNPADGATALAAVCRPVTTPTGQRVPGLPLANPRSQALLATLCVLRLLPNGFTNKDLPDTRLCAAAREFDKAFDHLLAQAHLKR